MDIYNFKPHVVSLVKSDYKEILAFCSFEDNDSNIDKMFEFFLNKKFNSPEVNIFQFDFRNCDFKTNIDDYWEEKNDKGVDGIYIFKHIAKAKPKDKQKIYKLISELTKLDKVKKIVIIDNVDETKVVLDKFKDAVVIALNKSILLDIYDQ